MKYLLDNWENKDSLEQKSIREGFGQGILRAVAKNEQVVVLNADLPSSLKLETMIETFPDNYLQVGVAEQNMAGIATGLSHYGKIPFITSFAAFNPGLNFAQIRTAAMGKQNLKIVSSHYGLNVGPDGASAQMESDLAMIKALPSSTIVNPADYNQAVQATLAIAEHFGIDQLRVTRANFPVFINPESDFEIGKGQRFFEGKDLTLIATGSMVYESLMAANILINEGISVDFINIHTVKPLDEEIIIESAKKTGKVVVVEEHNVWGGLGESVARVLGEKHPSHLKVIAMEDVFGESGEHRSLWEKYGFDSKSIHKIITSFLKRLS